MSLQTELVDSLGFDKNWQDAVKNKKTPFAKNDYISVFRLLNFLLPIQDRYPQTETKKFIELCLRCLIIPRINKPKYLADKELNDKLDDFFKIEGIHPKSGAARDFKNSLFDFIDSLYLLPAPSINHLLTKK